LTSGLKRFLIASLRSLPVQKGTIRIKKYTSTRTQFRKKLGIGHLTRAAPDIQTWPESSLSQAQVTTKGNLTLIKSNNKFRMSQESWGQQAME
jgi:hypothetical protein